MRRNRHDKLFIEGRERLTQEMDVVRLLKQLRYFDLAITELLSPIKASEYREQAKSFKLEHTTATSRF